MLQTYEKFPILAEILAAFTGDGWIEKRGTAIYITGSPTEDKWYYDNVMAPLFSSFFAPVRPRLYPYWGVYGIGSYKQAVIKKALSLGFHAGEKARIVAFPQELVNAKNDLLRKHLIRGLFDTDGGFHAHKQINTRNDFKRDFNAAPRISIATSSRKLAYQLKQVLCSFNFSPTISLSRARVVCGRNNNDSYRVFLNKHAEIDRFFLEIGSNNMRHVTRYALFKKLGHLPSYLSMQERLRRLEWHV